MKALVAPWTRYERAENDLQYPDEQDFNVESMLKSWVLMLEDQRTFQRLPDSPQNIPEGFNRVSTALRIGN
jgi:hypothetical protein